MVYGVPLISPNRYYESCTTAGMFNLLTPGYGGPESLYIAELQSLGYGNLSV